MAIPTVYAASPSIPLLSVEQMIEVDRLMMEDYQVSLIQMMENAGRGLARLAVRRFLKKKLKKKPVIVLAGIGGNGGGALVAARRLHGWGAPVSVYLSAGEDWLAPVPQQQLGILKRMRLPIWSGEELPSAEPAALILDGLIGYSLKGDPRGLSKAMIEWANDQEAPVLALDVPSGFCSDTGRVSEPTIRAAATLTLALPKRGLLTDGAAAYTGELYLADIGVPPGLYAEPSLGLKVKRSLFALGDLIRIETAQPPQQEGAKN